MGVLLKILGGFTLFYFIFHFRVSQKYVFGGVASVENGLREAKPKNRYIQAK